MTFRRIHSQCMHSFMIWIPTTAALSLAGCFEIRTPDPMVRYVAFGDSTTFGPTDPNYPEVLMELLNEPAGAVSNEGAGGESSEDGVARVQSLLSLGLFPNATTFLYWEGGVDIIKFIRDYDRLLLWRPDDPDYPFAQEWRAVLDAIQRNIEAAIHEARQRDLDVYVATYYSLYEGIIECKPAVLDTLLPVQAVNANAYIEQLNERIRAAADASADLVDVAADNAVLQSDRENFVDCNHLSVLGNDVVARRFAEAIRLTP